MRAVLGAAVTAAAYSLAYPPFGWEWLLWVALVPFLWVLERVGPARAALAGASFGALISVFIVSWIGPTLVGYYERSLPFTMGLLVLLWLTMGAPFYAAACAALAFVRPRVSRASWLLLVPVAWIAAEWARSRLGLRASWALVGDGFHEWARLRQIADVTAVYGIGFVVVLTNVVVFASLRALQDARARGPLLKVAAVWALLLASVLGYGESRLRSFTRSADAPALEVLLVQGNVEPRLRWQRAMAGKVLRRYGSLTRDAVHDAAPDLVVWPENAIQTQVDDATYGPPLQRLVSRLGIPLLLGAPRSERLEAGTLHYNSAFLLAPGPAPGSDPDHYDKRQLMPFGESDPLGDLFDAGRRGDLDGGHWRSGERPGLFAVDEVLFGVVICLEALYPELVRDLVASGAQVVVNLSNDGWFRGRGGPEQHFQQAIFRAIEVRRPLLRVTTTGVSAMVEPSGAVDRRLDWGTEGTLRVRVHPASGAPTFYARFGDVFAGGCAAILGAALAVSARRRPRA